MGRVLVRLIMVVSLMLGAVASQADVIYNNGDPNGYIGLTSDYNATILDDFELDNGASTLSDFHWYGAYYGDTPATDDFTLYIFDGSHNLLDTIDGSATTRSATGDSVSVPIFGGSYDEYYYELLLDNPLALSAGTTYYLGIANSNDADWAWEYSQILSGDADLWFQQQNYFQDGFGEFSYQLTGPGGVVPEPASMSILGFGLVALSMRGRRKRG